MQPEHDEFPCNCAPTPDIALEYGDDQWWVAVRRSEPQPSSTHERRSPGYASYVDATDAAIRFAIANDLTVASRIEMIEEAEETLRFFALDEQAFVE